jgi:signal transduction histidine kinase
MIRHILFTATVCGEMSSMDTFTMTSSFGGAWWLIIPIVGAITGLLIYFHYYRLRREIAIERMRSQIATDLHDDIGSTLSGIAIFSEMGCRETGEISPKASGLFRRIGESSLSILDAMDDIVWAINPENDSLQPLVVRMRDYATDILEAKQLSYHITMPTDFQNIKITMNERKNIYLLFKEGIHNLVKHSGCTHASIGIDMNKNLLRLHIKDDGVGFDLSTIRNGNGLNNMRRRAESIEALLSIESAPGKGTKITVQLNVT